MPIDYYFNLYLQDILNTYEGQPIKDVYEILLEYNAVERFITYIENTLILITGNNQEEKHKWLLKFLHISSFEQICRTIILCELIIDMLKVYSAPIINTDSPDPFLNCCSGCFNV